MWMGMRCCVVVMGMGRLVAIFHDALLKRVLAVLRFLAAHVAAFVIQIATASHSLYLNLPIPSIPKSRSNFLTYRAMAHIPGSLSDPRTFSIHLVLSLTTLQPR